MGYFPVRYNSRVVIYERKMFIIMATAIVGCAAQDVSYSYGRKYLLKRLRYL